MDPDAEVDSTLVFTKEMLDNVYDEVSPSVVAILLDPMSTGFIVKTSNTHNMIAVQNNLIGYGSETITVRYSDGCTSTVDHIERLPDCNIAVLHSRHLGKRRQAVRFGELDDKECQKIVTLFPYKNDLMFFKGHITLTDCTSESRSRSIVPGSENMFMLTCPVSASYELDREVKREERARCLKTVIGAAVFDLEGRVLGRIYAFGTAHTLKYAIKSSVFCTHLETAGLLDWQEEIEDKEKRNTNDLSSSDEEREPAPTVKEKKDKKGNTVAEQQVNGDRKLAARGEDDPANPNALANFRISELLKEKLRSMGINALLPIQATTFRLVLDGNDLVGRTGTRQDKTLAFVLPILESLVNGPHKGTRRSDYGRPPSVLVLLPTRELANQVHTDFKFYGGAFGLSTCCAYGGSHYRPQEIAMRKGVDVVVGTPGDIKDLIVKGALSLKCLKFHVLDEADEMLHMGFAEDVELILGKVDDVTKVQTLLFSATLPEWVKKLSMRFLKAEKRTVDLVGNEKVEASASVRHLALPCKRAARAQTIPDIIRCHSRGGRTIIFTETKESASELSSLIPGSRALYGDITQVQREVVIAGFRGGNFLVLVATNVAARGLDINDVQLIIQCEPPKDVEAYIHRSGQTGGAGNTGIAVTLFEPRYRFSLARIERESGVKFEHVSAPQPSDVAQSAGNEAADAIASVPDSVIPVFRQQAEQLLSSSGMSAVDLLAKALAKAVGYTDTKKRSLLSSMENHTTLHLQTGRPMRAPGVALTTLKRFMPEEKLSRVHGIALTADGAGAVFDVPSGEAEDYIQGAENAAMVTLDEVKQLPALQEREQSKRFGSGASSWGGGGQGGFNT